jgi:hypothetical protein
LEKVSLNNIEISNDKINNTNVHASSYIVISDISKQVNDVTKNSHDFQQATIAKFNLVENDIKTVQTDVDQLKNSIFDCNKSIIEQIEFIRSKLGI